MSIFPILLRKAILLNGSFKPSLWILDSKLLVRVCVKPSLCQERSRKPRCLCVLWSILNFLNLEIIRTERRRKQRKTPRKTPRPQRRPQLSDDEFTVETDPVEKMYLQLRTKDWHGSRQEIELEAITINLHMNDEITWSLPNTSLARQCNLLGHWHAGQVEDSYGYSESRKHCTFFVRLCILRLLSCNLSISVW